MRRLGGKLAVITIVSGRHRFLQRQRRALQQGVRRPDQHVVVAMGDPVVGQLLHGESRCVVVDIEAVRPLPLAKARNVGATAALAAGAETLVFLDVDCIPSPELLHRYDAISRGRSYGDGVLCGQVRHLPPADSYPDEWELLAKLSTAHPARPGVDPKAVVRTSEYELFWSLSFGLSAKTWRVLGGFCEQYVGYGGEDTDFGQRARAAGAPLYWVGGAVACHQHHPVSDPPGEHLDDILRNAEVFFRRWGWWPMRGWLEAFEGLGLIRFDSATGSWERVAC